jgi:hypothetical protein
MQLLWLYLFGPCHHFFRDQVAAFRATLIQSGDDLLKVRTLTQKLTRVRAV